MIPVYNNEMNLPYTIPYILERIPTLFPDYQVELILVNDGSPDNSWEIMKKYQSDYPETIRIVKLIHNFGQTNAISCGIHLARGCEIGVISADLQDPFDLFASMLKELQCGHDLVCAIREGRNEIGIQIYISQITHWIIKKFINPQYPIGGFDFFVINDRLAKRFLNTQGKNNSLQLSLLWLSSSVKFLRYTRQKRELGKSGWTFSKKVKLFIDTFVSNSYLPLRLMSVGGILFAGIAFCASIWIFLRALCTERVVPGWSSLVLLITFFSGLILTALGIIGEYLWRIYDEIKSKPLYIIDKILPDWVDLE